MNPSKPKDSENKEIKETKVTEETIINESNVSKNPEKTSKTPIEDKDDLKTFLEKIELNEITLPRTIILKENQVLEVLKDFAGKNELSINQAKVAITILFQSGGTNRSCDGNLEAKLFNKVIKLASLRKSLSDCKLKGCERKLARSLANEIQEISLKCNIEGNLSSRVKRLHPEATISLEISTWLSDFQANNPNCPTVARNYINECFEKKNETKKSNKKK